MEYRFQSQGKEYVVALESGPEGIRAWVDGRERRFRLHPARDGTLDLEVDGRRHRISCARDGSSLHLACEGEGYRLQKLDPLSPRAPQQHEHGLEAPMPGLVRRVAVPFACLAFAFLGVPLAVVARGGRGSAYLITVAAFVGFYAVSRFGVALAENGLNPWIAGFIPDAVVLVLGAAYTAQLIRSGVGKPR